MLPSLFPSFASATLSTRRALMPHLRNLREGAAFAPLMPEHSGAGIDGDPAGVVGPAHAVGTIAAPNSPAGRALANAVHSLLGVVAARSPPHSLFDARAGSGKRGG